MIIFRVLLTVEEKMRENMYFGRFLNFSPWPTTQNVKNDILRVRTY